MSKNSKTHTANRSAVTGRFVTEKFAKSHPRTTEKEHIPNPGRGLSDRKK